MLFQFGQLVPELSAADNVALPLLLNGAKRKPSRAAALKWLDRFGIADLANHRTTDMSGGQAQRVAVARAMVIETEVLFADEPTGALDALSGDQVMGQLTSVARDIAMTVLIVTHDAKVAAYGDREVTMRDGVIEELMGADGAV